MLELAESLRRVDHDREDAEAHAVHAGEAELGAGGLADEIEPEPAVEAILGRRLEPGPRRVDVEGARLDPGVRARSGQRRQARQAMLRGVLQACRLSRGQSGSRNRMRPGGDRARHDAGEIEDVAHHREIPRSEILGDPAGAVVDDHAADAGALQDVEDALAGSRRSCPARPIGSRGRSRASRRRGSPSTGRCGDLSAGRDGTTATDRTESRPGCPAAPPRPTDTGARPARRPGRGTPTCLTRRCGRAVPGAVLVSRGRPWPATRGPARGAARDPPRPGALRIVEDSRHPQGAVPLARVSRPPRVR